MLRQAPGLQAIPPAPTPLMLGRFGADRAAPLPSPLQMEIGQLTLTDASNVISQSGGQLFVSGTPAALSGAVASASLARSTGLAVIFTVRRLTTTTASRLGLLQSAVLASTPYAGVDLSSAVQPRANSNGGTIASFMEAIGTGDSHHWEIAFILRSAGFHVCVRESPSAAWVLGYISTVGSTAVWPHISAAAAVAQSFAVRSLRAVQLGGPWTNDYGIAKARLATTANGSTLVADPFGIYEHTITAATGVTQELSFRYVTDNDRWLIRLDQTGGTVKIYEVVASVETLRGAGTATLTMTNGVQYRVVVQCKPSAAAGQDTITVMTQTGGVAESFKDTYTGAASGRNVGLLKASHAGANLVSWPRGVPMLEAA